VLGFGDNSPHIIRLKANQRLDAIKLERALISGLEIEKRQPKQQAATSEQDYKPLADEYNVRCFS
jgi:hypothetical protein